MVPDCIKAWVSNKKAYIRNPNATRPWQHVLEPLSGYIILSYNLQKNKRINGNSFNFGPKFNEVATVKKVLQLSQKFWINAKFNIYKKKFFKEDDLLRLNSIKAQKTLKWKKILNIEKTIQLTMNWYKKFYKNNDPSKLIDSDINHYLKLRKSILNEQY